MSATATRPAWLVGPDEVSVDTEDGDDEGDPGSPDAHLALYRASHRRDQRTGQQGICEDESGGCGTAAEDEQIPRAEWREMEMRDDMETEAEALDECPYPVVLEGEGPDGETKTIEKDCGRRGCPYCGPIKRDRLIAHFATAFTRKADDHPVYMLTLTTDPKTGAQGELEEPAEQRKYLMHSWDKYLKRIRRRAEDFDYLGIVEAHEGGGQNDGKGHMHALFSGRFVGLSGSPVDPEDRSEVRQMLHSQWFASGGGVKATAKRVRADETGMGEDGRPDGIAGAVGYTVKYLFKDPDGEICASQGFGYDSEKAKSERRDHQKRQNIDEDEPEGYDGWTWETPGRDDDSGGRRRTLTDEDRRRFERIDRSARSQSYRERVDDAEEYGGRTVWMEYIRGPDGVIRRTVYDGWPEASGTRMLDKDGSP